MERSMVFNLSPIEIKEEDCGTSHGFDIFIKNKKQADSLVNRWIILSNKTCKLFTKNDADTSVGQPLTFRSPITCKTKNLGICQKCFGEYRDIPTPYVGILAGQYIAERLTQLAMSSFHTSGSCTLPVNKQIKQFIKLNILKIENYEDYSNIYFSEKIPSDILEELKNIEGFTEYDPQNSAVKYKNISKVENEDVGRTIIEVNKIVNSEKTKKNIITPNITYSNLLKHIHNVGFIYSTFVEIVLANVYITKNNEILRYALDNNTDTTISKKISIKRIHTMIESGLLSFLYEPNSITLLDSYRSFNIKDKDENLTIFEKIWTGEL